MGSVCKFNHSFPDPGRGEKTNLNFYFHAFLRCLKEVLKLTFKLIFALKNFQKYTGQEGLRAPTICRGIEIEHLAKMD